MELVESISLKIGWLELNQEEFMKLQPGTILFIAHRDLESITVDKETQHQKDKMTPEIATLIYNGLWYSNQMRAINAYIQETQKKCYGNSSFKTL